MGFVEGQKSKRGASLRILLSFTFLVSIICSATLPVLGLQYSQGISSYGTINYSTTGPPSGGLHVDGRYLKDSSGNIVILRGVVFASDQWWDYNYPACYSENQFVYMKNWGCNVVRITVQCYTLENICDANGEIINSKFLSRLDQLINWAGNQGLYVILNGFHPGGSCSHGNLRVNCNHYMNVHWNNWNNWINLWKQYATRYASKTHVLYELLSEPINCDYATYQAKNRACIDAIRAIDPDSIIVVHAVDATTQYYCTFEFEQSYPISRSNIAYADHTYAYHYGSNTRQSIRDRLTFDKADWMIANGRCVIFTEFGPGGPGAPDWTIKPWTGNEDFNTVWLQNLMIVLDTDGYGGYQAFRWSCSDTTYAFYLLADWNGNPSGYGNVIRTYYLTHPS